MNRPYIGGMHRKISVGLEGISAYLGKRSGPNPGSWHQGSAFFAYFRDMALGFIKTRTPAMNQEEKGKSSNRFGPKAGVRGENVL